MTHGNKRKFLWCHHKPNLFLIYFGPFILTCYLVTLVCHVPERTIPWLLHTTTYRKETKHLPQTMSENCSSQTKYVKWRHYHLLIN